MREAPDFVRDGHEWSIRHHTLDKESSVYRGKSAAELPDGNNYQRLRRFFESLPWSAPTGDRYILAAGEPENPWATMRPPEIYVGGKPFGQPKHPCISALGWPDGAKCHCWIHCRQNEIRALEAILKRCRPLRVDSTDEANGMILSVTLLPAESLAFVD